MTPAELAEDLAARAARTPVLAAVMQGAIDAYAEYQDACRTADNTTVRELRAAAFAANDCAGLALLALTGRPYSEGARDQARNAVKEHVLDLCGPPAHPTYTKPSDRPRVYPPAPARETGQEGGQEETP